MKLYTESLASKGVSKSQSTSLADKMKVARGGRSEMKLIKNVIPGDKQGRGALALPIPDVVELRGFLLFSNDISKKK